MTCAECREAFSARVDDALSADARLALEQHLAGCAECRREWQRFVATVDLLRAVQPERAPAGFVDRVLTAARPQPWYRRALRGLFVPWPVKLPLEAAALVLVAGLAVMIFQRSPELQGVGVGFAPPAPVERQAPRSNDMIAPVEAPARPSAPAQAAKSEVAAVQEERLTAQEAKSGAPHVDATAPRAAAEAGRRDSSSADVAQQQAQQLLLARRQQLADQQTALQSRDDKGAARPPEQERAEVRKKLLPSAPAAPAPMGAAAVPKAAAPPAKAAERDLGQGFVPPDTRVRSGSFQELAARSVERVELRLTVADRVAAAREISAVVGRLGGTMLPRRETGGLELTVPREAYPALTRELGRVGTLAVVAQPRELPQPVPVGVTLTE